MKSSPFSRSALQWVIFGFSAIITVIITAIVYATASWGSLPMVNTGSGLSANAWNDLVAHVNQSVKQSSQVITINGSNVGIGTTTPWQNLSVSWVIESTNWWVKFPDGTTQTTASNENSGIVRQFVSSINTTPFTAQGTAIPLDNTIPQITEGYQVLSATITPKFANSRIIIEATVNYDEPSNVWNGGAIALFKDSGPDAIAVAGASVYWQEVSPRVATLRFVTTASSTTTTRTYTIRIGCNVANCIEVNREWYLSWQAYGGTMASTLFLTEIAP